MTVALTEEHPLDVVKLLYTIEIHPIEIISALNIAKSSDEIIEHLLTRMDELIEGPTFMEQWTAFKWDYIFWRKSAPIRGDIYFNSIVGTSWNVNTNFQAGMRVFRSTTFIAESYWNTSTNYQAEVQAVRSPSHWTEEQIAQAISRPSKSFSHMYNDMKDID